MRIVVVCSRLSYGGAERVAVLWANGFYRRNHDVMVIANLYDPITYSLDDGIIVRNLVSDNQNRINKWSSSVYNVRKHVKDFVPDVILGVMELCSLVAKLATWGLGIPVIMTDHWSFERPNNIGMPLVYRLSKFYVNKIYDTVTILTEADKKVIGTRLKNVSVMPNPLGLIPVQEIPLKQNTLLAVGRLDAWHVKGFDVLIRAWAKIVNSEELIVKRDGWKLQIAGTGSEKSLNYLKQLCKENGVEDFVEFLGFQKNIEKLYQKASIFVLSSRYEGFGLVLIEAMSQGCACVACDYKGRQREIIQNDSQGLCCEPDNVDALAEAITKMIVNDEYRESVRLNAIERSNYYSIENTIDRWELVLDKVVHK